MASQAFGLADVAGGTHDLRGIPAAGGWERPHGLLPHAQKLGRDGKVFYRVTRTRNLSHSPSPHCLNKINLGPWLVRGTIYLHDDRAS